MSIKNWFRNWLLSNDVKLATVSPMAETDAVHSNMMFSFIRATNGVIIKVSKFKHNPHGPDWTHELHIVREDETIQDAVIKVMAIYSLELS
jgi:hypothetical protein